MFIIDYFISFKSRKFSNWNLYEFEGKVYMKIIVWLVKGVGDGFSLWKFVLVVGFIGLLGELRKLCMLFCIIKRCNWF